MRGKQPKKEQKEKEKKDEDEDEDEYDEEEEEREKEREEDDNDETLIVEPLAAWSGVRSRLQVVLPARPETPLRRRSQAFTLGSRKQLKRTLAALLIGHEPLSLGRHRPMPSSSLEFIPAVGPPRRLSAVAAPPRALSSRLLFVF
jgi:hypothetical protein